MQSLSSLFGTASEQAIQDVLGTEALRRWRLIPTPTSSLLQKRSTELDQAAARLTLPPNSEVLALLSPEHRALLESEEHRNASLIDARRRNLAAQLADAQERDRLQADRPEGCFCLGIGGAGAAIQVEASIIWARPCLCPEALAQQAALPGGHRSEQDDEHIAQVKAQLLRAAIAAARLPQDGRTWADFQDARQTSIVARLRVYAEAPRGALFLFGQPGRGKTTLLALACRSFICATDRFRQDLGDNRIALRARSALLCTVDEYLATHRPTDSPEHSDAFAPDLAAEVDLLALDDLGTKRLTDWGHGTLLDLINSRYRRRAPTLFSSNYGPRELAPRLAGPDGDPVAGKRLVERMIDVDWSALLFLDGPNYRTGLED